MKPARVLVVESNATDQSALTKCLQSWGHAVQSATTATEGLELAAHNLYDIIITNTDLDQQDGIQLISQIRNSDPTIKSIILTDHQDQSIAVRALEAGVTGFVQKPYSDETLKSKFDHVLDLHQKTVDNRLWIGDLIRNRNKLFEKIMEREKFLDNLINAAPFAIYATDDQDQILTFNKKSEELYGYKKDEIIGKPTQMLWSDVPITQNEKVQTHHKNKAGNEFPVYIQRRDIQNAEGLEIAHLYIVEDLSERQKMEDQLLYAERLSLLGQLAPRIAHEFKTPIQLIAGQAELASIYLSRNQIEDAQKSLTYILPASGKISDLVEQMLNLGKPTQHNKEQLNLLEELKNTLDPLQHLGTVKYCKIEWDVAEPLPLVKGDTNQIEQVFRNLIVNAAQAMECVRSDRKLKFSLYRHKKDPFVIVQIEDSGPGIPQSDLNQIFQPFYTTKPKGEGTGLGLAIVKTILDHHNAHIQVESVEGKGTTFILSFPIIQE